MILTPATLAVFAASTVFLLVYAVRHFLFALWRLSRPPATDPMESVGYCLPKLTVFVPMHNEETVAADVLHALLECDYDWDRLQILAINDRSSDATGAIIDGYCADFDVIQAVHIPAAPQGNKAIALTEAQRYATGDIYLIFDADYIPGRPLLKMLATPFADPAVGAVMGRVIPHNTGSSLLAGFLGMERAAGYQTGQQSRQDLLGLAQFGGTVGGVRASALEAAGGWNTSSLTEDTDLTCRLLTSGWRVVYSNRAECYEQVPERWSGRRRQLTRWVQGHNACLHRYAGEVLRSRRLKRVQKLDLLLMLACYWTAPAILAAWGSSLALFFLPGRANWFAPALFVTAVQMFAGAAGFLEAGVAALLDGSRGRALLLPLSVASFFANTTTICGALLGYYWRVLTGRGGGGPWQRTERVPVDRAALNEENTPIYLARNFRPARQRKVIILGGRRTAGL